jgi:hypothetical protein
LHQSYEKYKIDERKKESWYRILWPKQADFTPKVNLYHNRDAFTNYQNEQFPNADYVDHLH